MVVAEAVAVVEMSLTLRRNYTEGELDVGEIIKETEIRYPEDYRSLPRPETSEYLTQTSRSRLAALKEHLLEKKS